MNSARRVIAKFLSIASVFVLGALDGGAQTAPAAHPHRVVSLAPSLTETIFALGFGDRLVGVTSQCDYPAEARKIPKIGSFMNPSLEAVVAKRPDLVLGVKGATDPTAAREMARLGVKINLISLTSVSEILGAVKRIAGLLGDPQPGATLASSIAAQIERVKRRVAPARRRSVLFVVGLRPLVAVGGQNFIDELITLAGGENIAADAAQPWLNLPDEYVVAKAPEVIIEAGMGSERGESARHWRDLKSIPAVKQRRIYSHPSDKILRPGPRIGEGLEEIARLVHPECFGESQNHQAKGAGCESPRP